MVAGAEGPAGGGNVGQQVGRHRGVGARHGAVLLNVGGYGEGEEEGQPHDDNVPRAARLAIPQVRQAQRRQHRPHEAQQRRRHHLRDGRDESPHLTHEGEEDQDAGANLDGSPAAHFGDGDGVDILRKSGRGGAGAPEPCQHAGDALQPDTPAQHSGCRRPRRHQQRRRVIRSHLPPTSEDAKSQIRVTKMKKKGRRAGCLRLTESTEAMTDATHMTRTIFHSKMGVPHCNGYGSRNHGDDRRAREVSARHCFILGT